MKQRSSSRWKLCMFINLFVCMSVHSLFQSDFSTECDIVLSSFNSQYLILSLKSSTSYLLILPRLPVTSILPSIYPSITCFRRQLLRKIWPIQLAFRLCTVCRIFLSSSTLRKIFFDSRTIGPTDLLNPSTEPLFKTFQAFLIYFPKCPKFQHHTKLYSKCSSLLVKRAFFWLNAAFAMAILDLISPVLSCYPNSWNIPKTTPVFDLS